MSPTDRATRMARRVEAAATALGIDDSGRGLLSRALVLAMGPRRRLLEDEHDPAYLHPGRCVVILLEDLGDADARTLAAAAMVESERRDLRVPLPTVEHALGTAVCTLVASVPSADSDDLAESLVLAAPTVRRIALVERLDQLRHAHLWADLARRQRAHDSAQRVYLPIAQRTDALLARRYRWWCRMFSQRYLG